MGNLNFNGFSPLNQTNNINYLRTLILYKKLKERNSCFKELIEEEYLYIIINS